MEATLAGPAPLVHRALSADPQLLFERGKNLASALQATGLDARAVESQAAVGGGGAPGVPLASAAVSLPASLAGALRDGEAVRTGRQPAVIGRITDGRLLLDLYAIEPADDDALAAAVVAAGKGQPPCK
jgi:L-seryl-tRNA(Ser) seleniumtransferase